MKRKLILILMMCMLGLAIGMLGRHLCVRASSPEGGCPIAVEGVPTVVYDETWRPLTGLVSAKNGSKYEVCKYNFTADSITFSNNATSRLSDATSGEMSKDPANGMVLPKFKVTQWQVSGHAHFK